MLHNQINNTLITKIEANQVKPNEMWHLIINNIALVGKKLFIHLLSKKLEYLWTYIYL